LNTKLATNKKRLNIWPAGCCDLLTYIHTPKYGSWLNFVERLFGKMARIFLNHIRVNTKQELKTRILKGIQEINDTLIQYLVASNKPGFPHHFSAKAQARLDLLDGGFGDISVMHK
jgi:hypothetical protein